jgi:hypothetical protein
MMAEGGDGKPEEPGRFEEGASLLDRNGEAVHPEGNHQSLLHFLRIILRISS